MAGSASLVELVGRIEDPRLERTRRHRLVDILALAVLAVIAGAEGWEDIEDFGHARIGWLRPFLRLENGTLVRPFPQPREFGGFCRISFSQFSL